MREISHERFFIMFGTKLKRLRTERNMRQELVAKAAGISTRTYMDYENGKNEPKVSTAKKIAEALEVPLSELLEEDNNSDALQAHQIMLFMKSLDDEDKEVIKKILFGLRLRARFMDSMNEEEGNELF
ncbi:helix-turn-helix transcriptional regulator [Vibrio parahaemolyticus]|nr:helix-turn-helix transcriptional regulator [Vibrio parahaemolyticus]